MGSIWKHCWRTRIRRNIVESLKIMKRNTTKAPFMNGGEYRSRDDVIHPHHPRTLEYTSVRETPIRKSIILAKSPVTFIEKNAKFHIRTMKCGRSSASRRRAGEIKEAGRISLKIKRNEVDMLKAKSALFEIIASFNWGRSQSSTECLMMESIDS